MSVSYKFKSTSEVDTVPLDCMHISVADLKKIIFERKKIGKNTGSDLLIVNAQTKESYLKDNDLIAKNTSLIVSRVPLIAEKKFSPYLNRNSQPQNVSYPTPEVNVKIPNDLSKLNLTEEDKILAMISQSTYEYDPANYSEIRGSNQTGQLPSNYCCRKCHQPGHWIKDCPLGFHQKAIKKSKGIPKSFMIEVDGPSVPGAMLTPQGFYAVRAIDNEVYQERKRKRTLLPQDSEPVSKKPNYTSISTRCLQKFAN